MSLISVPYVFGEIKNREKIADFIDHILKKCIEENIHIVVFPELSIDDELRNYIKNWLKVNNIEKDILMVIAGSYHILKDKKEDIYENSSIVYRFDGEILWKQEKINQFKMDEKDIKRLLSSKEKGFEEFKRLFRKTDRSAWEKIDISNTLLIYDSSIGRMAVTICLDYFVKEKNKLLIEPSVNMIFVPSMSSTLKKAEEASYEGGTLGTASIFCANSCWIVTGGERGNFNPEHSSYIYIPQKGGLKHIEHCPDCDCISCNLHVFRISEGIKK